MEKQHDDDRSGLASEYIRICRVDFNQITYTARTLAVRGALAIGVSIPFGLALATFQSQAKTKSINGGMNAFAPVYYETVICPKTPESYQVK